MRLDSGITPAGTNDSIHYLPNFFMSHYPELVEFMDLYLDSLYKGDLSPDQVKYFMEEDDSWWVNKGREYATPDDAKLQRAKDLEIYRRNNFGLHEKTVELLDNKSLQRRTSLLFDLSGLLLSDNSSISLLAPRNENLPLKQWLESKNFKELAETLENDLNFDVINFIKFSRHLYKIKGSLACAKLLLETFYESAVVTELPRIKIATLDDNFTLDEDKKLRDDFVYDEFTYIVNLIGDKYFEIGDKYFEMYKRVFHPSGFRIILRVYTQSEWDNL